MEKLLERRSVLVVKKFLQTFNSTINLIELDTTARTAQDAAKSLKQDVGSIIKSLLFKTNENDFYLCLVSGDKYISEKKLLSVTQKKILKANADEVKKQTGFSIGGVPPVAHLSRPTCVYIDKNLKRFDLLYAAAGHPYVVFAITFNEVCKITKGKIIDFVK